MVVIVAVVSISSPGWMAVGGGLAVATVAIAAARRAWLGRGPSACVAIGAACWVAAAGSPAWVRPFARSVDVMVDLSPSTRGADYRNRAALDRRVAELLGDVPHRLLGFADEPPRPLPAGAILGDLPCDATTFVPPTDADAVVLFSDGRFAPPPVAPPTFPVIDPALGRATDAAVTDLRATSDRATATVSAPTDRQLTLRWTGAAPPSADATGGGVVFATPTGDAVAAAVAGHDLWPENDQLAIRTPPPATPQRWWVGERPPPPGFVAVALPTDVAAYLSAGVVVLDDVPAEAMTSEQRRQLAGYVRDLGGGLVIGGGPHAFAAGGYGGTVIDAVSPLASDPPGPAERWVVLVDASGSMAAGGPPSPWQVECDAVAQLVPLLPPADPVRTGSFAAAVRWWGTDAPPATATVVPPAGVYPGGPTNLAVALHGVAASADVAVPTNLILMTDADADLPDAAAITAELRAHRVSLQLLATGAGSALATLRAMVTATHGTIVQQADPAAWVAAARQLTRGVVPKRFANESAAVRWHDLAGPASVSSWNRTWLRPRAEALADTATAPLAAAWPIGTGHAAAVAFAADPSLLARLAERVSAAPRDPRFTVTWSAGSRLGVSVDAVDRDRYLNGRTVIVRVGDGPAIPITQAGPGRYAAELPAPRQPAIATVAVDGRTIDRFAVPGRYAAEFDAIGIDRPALAELARQTGGAIVEPADHQPLRFPGPPRRTELGPPLSAAGAAAVAVGLVWWRRRRG